ncbi:hypothetical protein [uncultured Kordia sp.]|uniref:hypothetical protein n=1 Tax=uncultured Kordia sp. TaxID=507699 RepID=UPI00261B37FC|nr:hypothetical protein [uncultured Kordia sp.]
MKKTNQQINKSTNEQINKNSEQSKLKTNMHKYIKNILPILLLIGFTSCSSQQTTMKLQEKPPFTVLSSFSQPWTSGQEGGGGGLNVHMTIQNLNTKKITLKDFYFRGEKTKLEDNSTNNNGLYVARYLKPVEKEIILHNDHKKEAGNEPPKLQPKFPGELKNNEGIISYEEDGKLKYYKLENIIYRFPIYYPSAPPNKQ